MIFTAHQTNFIPYAGFWLKADKADIFGLMSNAQYGKGNLHNRVLIGEEEKNRWLTVPVEVNLGDKINQVKIARSCKMKKILGGISEKYSRYPYWDLYGTEIMSKIQKFNPGDLLVDLNLALIFSLVEMLEINTEFIEVASSPENSASKNLSTWCIENKCRTYLSGMGGKNYLDHEEFHKKNVNVKYHDPVIQKGFGKVSILTALMSMGENWRDIGDDSRIIDG